MGAIFPRVPRQRARALGTLLRTESCRIEAVRRVLLVRLARPHHDRWEVGMVRGIGVLLRFERERATLGVVLRHGAERLRALAANPGGRIGA